LNLGKLELILISNLEFLVSIDSSVAAALRAYPCFRETDLTNLIAEGCR